MHRHFKAAVILYVMASLEECPLAGVHLNEAVRHFTSILCGCLYQ